MLTYQLFSKRTEGKWKVPVFIRIDGEENVENWSEKSFLGTTEGGGGSGQREREGGGAESYWELGRYILYRKRQTDLSETTRSQNAKDQNNTGIGMFFIWKQIPGTGTYLI